MARQSVLPFSPMKVPGWKLRLISVMNRSGIRGTAMMSFFLPSSRLIIETTTQYSVAYTAAVAIVKPIMIM